MKLPFAIALLILSLVSHAQTPTITSTYSPTGNCQNFVYGNGVYVAVDGGLFTSTDAKNWTPVPSGNVPIPGPNRLAFGNGVFVATTFPNDIYSSTDGVNWTLRASGIIAYDVEFLNGAFYTLRDEIYNYKSTDGINWTPLPMEIGIPWLYTFTGFQYGGGNYVIGMSFSDRGIPNGATAVYYSPTGEPGSWTFSGLGLTPPLTKLMWLKDRFYLFAGTDFLTSMDGITWSAPPVPLVDTLTDGTIGTLPPMDPVAGYAAGDSIYLMGPNPGNGTYSMQVSTDHTHFKSLYSSGMVANGGLYVNGTHFIYGTGGIATSTDGIHFKFNSTNFTGLATNGSGFVAVGSGGGGHMFSSPDFADWTDRTPPTTGGLPAVSTVLYTGTKYVAGGARNIYFSDDGTSWSTQTVPYSFISMAYGAGRYVAGSYNDTTYMLTSSTDGINWSVVDPSYNYYYKIRYINNSFFAMGVSYLDNTGRIMQSADGLHWQNITPAVSFRTAHYSDVMFDGTKYYFTGIKKDSSGNWADFFTLSTTNPMNTTSYSAPGSIVNPAPGTSVGDYITQFGDFLYHNGQFVGSAADRVNHQAYLVYSSDGMNWTTTPLNGPEQARTIVMDGDIYRIVGDGGGRYSITFPGTPATLLDFKAKAVGSRDGEDSRLSWRTAGESNIAYFLIQHSLDTLHWDSIGKVNAIERSHGRTGYQFTHEGPPAGANYYRLGLVDKDGRRQWSSIRRVDIRNKGNIRIYPNPVRGVLRVQLPGPEPASLSVYNSAGRMVRQQVVSGYSATLDLGSLPAGVYHLLVLQGGKRYHKEFIIAGQSLHGY